MLLSFLTEPFEEFTLAWLLLSALLGGIIGACITIFSDEVIRPWFSMRRQTRKLYKKYKNPISSAANTLERQINTIVRSKGEAWLRENYFTLSTCYKFGVFFFWVRQIEQDLGYLQLDSSKKTKEFTRTLYGPFAGISSIRRYFKDQTDSSRVVLRRDFTRAIGEDMLADSSANTDHPHPIGFSNFVRRFDSDPQFAQWFSSLIELLKDCSQAPPEIIIERLIVTGAHLKLLLKLLDPKGDFHEQKTVNLELITRDSLIQELKKAGVNK